MSKVEMRLGASRTAVSNVCRSRGRRGRARRRVVAGFALVVVLTVAIAGVFGDSASAHRRHVQRLEASATVASSAGGRPANIVFVLTDDLSMDLIPFMPHVKALERDGLTFTNYFVSDSLCCPSRASIFTGNYPHDTGVFTNTGPRGGVFAFYAHDEQLHTFNDVLRRHGYLTAMMGKYLNGYLRDPVASIAVNRMPRGWNEWDVAGWGYPEYNYALDDDGIVHHYRHRPTDYLTGVLARKGVKFINRAARSGHPFFLELATFAPHTPYTPAPSDQHRFPGLKAPEPPSFDQLPAHAPRWLSDHPRLTQRQVAQINWAFRKRAQAVQAVDRMIGRVEAALAAHGKLKNTYIVFSSDNGLHTGEYRLMPGKLTAFDTDIHVPLVVAGPGIPHGATTTAMAENIDLAKTFAAIDGATKPSDGHSLIPLLEEQTQGDWRNAILVEHQGPVTGRANPDKQTRVTGNPPSYEAIRTPEYLYVEYETGEREFYDLQSDPYELDNIAASLSRAQLAQLHHELGALKNCHTGPKCWAAEHVAPLAAGV